MNKKILLLMLVFVFISVVDAAADNPIRKLERGVVNIVTAPLEIPVQSRVYWKEGAKKTDHIVVWIFSGFVKGNVNMIARLGSGTWDLVTFPICIPKKYDSLYKPDWVLDHLKE